MIGKPVEVRLDDMWVDGESYDFWLLIKRPPFSLLERIRKEKPLDVELPDFITIEMLGKHIQEWKSEAFEDVDTDEVIECNPANVAQVIEDTPEMYWVFNTALMRAHMDTVRKNSKTSLAGHSTGDEASVKDAGTTSG